VLQAFQRPVRCLYKAFKDLGKAFKRSFKDLSKAFKKPYVPCHWSWLARSYFAI
jgi:hypothetical protein